VKYIICIKASVLVSIICHAATSTYAGTEVKWDKVPQTVRDTVLANGGKAGPIDRESGTKDGKVIYEAQVIDERGVVKDLVITSDGKLIETKTDDAEDEAADRLARAKELLRGVKFSHPTVINNPYLPLSSLKQDILEGTEDGKKVRVLRTARPDVHKSFKIGDMTVESLAFEDRVFIGGQPEEVALDYYAQDDNGTVYYFGEDVDEYKDGKIANHEGSWMVGKDTPVPGVMFPANPKVGAKWRPEDVSRSIGEKDEIVAAGETVVVPAGNYKDCIKVKEVLADGTVEYKYYAKGIGIVRELPSDGDEKLVSHATK
jgi:hypothetical protein